MSLRVQKELKMLCSYIEVVGGSLQAILYRCFDVGEVLPFLSCWEDVSTRTQDSEH